MRAWQGPGEALEALLRSRSGELCASTGPGFFICKMAPPLAYTLQRPIKWDPEMLCALCSRQERGGESPDLPSP